MNTLITREAWLLHIATRYLWPRILAAGGRQPERYRVSIGFPKGRRGGKGHSIGQCWSDRCSADDTYEIFVSPELSAAQVLGVLAHELCHASAGVECGHKAPFKRLAIAIGLSGPMRSTVPGKQLANDIASWLAIEAPYPHAPLIALPGKPGSRLIKASCESCGYTVRTTRQWLELSLPVCPNIDCHKHHESMAIESAPSPTSGEVANGHL